MFDEYVLLKIGFDEAENEALKCVTSAPYTSNFYDLESFLPAQVKREEARKQREALKNDELNVSKLTFGSYQRWLLKKGPDAFD